MSGRSFPVEFEINDDQPKEVKGKEYNIKVGRIELSRTSYLTYIQKLLGDSEDTLWAVVICSLAADRVSWLRSPACSRMSDDEYLCNFIGSSRGLSFVW